MSSYWNNREIQERLRLLDSSVAVTEKQVIDQYRRVQKELLEKMETLYYRITNDPSHIANDLYRYNGYLDLLNQIESRLTSMGVQTQTILESRFYDLYEKNYGIVKTKIKHLVPNEQRIKEVINGIWVNDGKNWSDRLWTNQKALAINLENSFVDNITRGASVQEMTEEIMKNFDASYSNASRLVRTESSHIWNSSTLDKYKDAGITRYRVLSEPDCCEKCKELNDKVFDISEQIVPVHPNCRCTVLAVDE